jgi:hypothetical protein
MDTHAGRRPQTRSRVFQRAGRIRARRAGNMSFSFRRSGPRPRLGQRAGKSRLRHYRLGSGSSYTGRKIPTSFA